MKRMAGGCLSLGAAVSVCLCVSAVAGPLHDAAMEEVERGIALCPTGNLDAAMEIFKAVEQQFPDETEAVGWARYWHSNCLLAGWRLSEIPPLMQPVWEQVVAGEITSPTAAFLFGHQYARVLDTGNYLRSVCERTMEFYEQLESPGVQIEEKAGFLQVSLSRPVPGGDVWQAQTSLGLAPGVIRATARDDFPRFPAEELDADRHGEDTP